MGAHRCLIPLPSRVAGTATSRCKGTCLPIQSFNTGNRDPIPVDRVEHRFGSLAHRSATVTSKALQTCGNLQLVSGHHGSRSHPLKPGKRDVPVVVGGVTIQPRDYLYADEDGVIVTDRKIAVPSDASKEKHPPTIPGQRPSGGVW